MTTYGKIQLIKEFRTMMDEKFNISLGLKETKDLMDLIHPIIEKKNGIINVGSIVSYRDDIHNGYYERQFRVLHVNPDYSDAIIINDRDGHACQVPVTSIVKRFF